MTTGAPLAGLRILSLAQQYPGPFATLLLADLGADVILVEQPGLGDPSRRFPGLFASLNRNKRSITLDLKSSQGHDDFLALVDTADVVLEGFRPGAMERLGLGAADLRARKPGLIYVSISAFGHTGPLSTLAGHDLSIQGAAGMLDIPVGKEAEAALPRLPLADIASAMYAALAIVSALRARDQAGDGTTLDISMFDALLSWMTPFIVPPMNGLPVRPLPPLDPGYGIFATADQRQITLSIAGEDAMWRSLCEFLGLDDLAALTEAERDRLASRITPRLREAIARHGLETLCRELADRRIAFGPVNTVDTLIDDPHVARRGMIETLPAGGAPMRFVREPMGFAPAGAAVRQGVPELGEHTRDILEALRRG
ncbi:CoA transferase [Alcaligenaceae bacterium]|nr:CoA transferase [Alcaligenaceae bacterium]